MKGVVIHARVRSHIWQYRGMFSPPTETELQHEILFAKGPCILCSQEACVIYIDTIVAEAHRKHEEPRVSSTRERNSKLNLLKGEHEMLCI